MIIEEVKKMQEPIDRLLYWIAERWTIYQKRLKGDPPPWTLDEILAKYRFCNVRRMDDKVSVWLLENWYSQNYNHPNMLLACALARFINLPSTLEVIGFPYKWEPEKIKSIVRGIMRDGRVAFSQAYMIRATDGEDKIASVIDTDIASLFCGPKGKLLTLPVYSMRLSHAKLMRCYGMGSFMAGQIIADMRWGVGAAKRGGGGGVVAWMDRNEWAPIGPGSRRGMNRIQGRRVSYPLNQARFMGELLQLRDIIIKRLPPKITYNLEMMDYQNCLCEYDKYERVLWGEGKPKQLYCYPNSGMRQGRRG